MSAKTNYDKASELDRQGRESEALKLYESAFHEKESLSDEDLKGLYLGLGSTYRWNQKVTKSIATLEEAVDRFPENSEFRIFLSLSQLDQGDSRGAVANLIKVLLTEVTNPNIIQYKRALEEQVSILLNP